MRVLLTLAVVAAISCSVSRPDPTSATAETDWFVDRAADTGLRFTHVNGMSGKFYFPEVMPPGVALLDYDNDGDLDVYFVQGHALESGVSADSKMSGRLFRNDLAVSADGNRSLRFTDVTSRAGLMATGYGMGAAAGDIDNDGWTDLYLTYFGANRMLRNKGDGTFEDVSQPSGTGHSGFSASAAFVDYDRDGWLDLYVTGYVTYSLATDQKCTDLAGVRGYCPPQVYSAAPDHLYRNQGSGTFIDVTDRALLGRAFGRGLGVVTADFNGDGWSDIYVANDGGDNLLWTNRRNGTFRNEALLAGVAVTAEGHAEASMGVDAGDFDNDGDEDLFMTELTGEGSNLYVNIGGGPSTAPGTSLSTALGASMFEDRSAASGVGAASREYTGFGTAWFDFDNDGWLDLLSVNGRVQAAEGTRSADFPMHQRKLLLRNLRDGRFEDVSAKAGAAFTSTDVGRGAAFGDVDNDGDADVVVSNDAGRAQLLINTAGNRRHWIGLRLVGTPGNRDMLGAVVTITRGANLQGCSTGACVRRRARSDGSYASANDPRVLVGLGDRTDVVSARVRWPDGKTEEWRGVAADKWHTLVQGTSK